MKYESELLNQIISDRGHQKSSIHYESECKEAFIDETKGAYPKLCDYEAEWLNYINENPIGEFPYETITDVTEATVNHVVPFAFKSAILKGNTLVNLIRPIGKTILEKYQDVVYLIHVKPSTKYLLKIKNNTTEPKSFYSSEITEWTQIDIEPNQTITKTLTTKSTLGRNVLLQNSKTHATEHNLSIIFIEYQDGMENWDIPYFEGMKSVKMPVLTTTGKNLYPSNNSLDYNKNSNHYLLENYFESNSQYVTQATVELTTKNGKWTPMIGYEYTDGSTSEQYFELHEENEVGTILSSSFISEKGKTVSKIYIRSPWGVYGVFSNIQIEEGTQITSYEPHKSNILTTPSDLELRGIGDVKDALDCLTGELHLKLDSKNLSDEDIQWNMQPSWETETLMTFGFDTTLGEGLLCNNFIKGDGGTVMGTERAIRSFYAHSTGWFVAINKSELSEVSVQGFKEWLNTNPTFIIYKLPKESIKTVDLSIVNQDGETISKLKPIEGTMHMKTDGQPLKPLLSAEIPVEAITQNLASFINEE